MAKNFEAKGGTIVYNAEVSALKEHASGVVIRTRQGGEYEASTLIACSGLMADRLVKMLGVDPGFIICPFRGEYFQLAPQHNQIVNHLIYPIPDPAMPFLGVHLTRMIDGSVTVGPNAVLALKREGYRKRDISLADTLEILTSPGIRRVLQNNLRSGLGEMKNSLCRSGYLRLVQKLPEPDAERFTPVAGRRAGAGRIAAGQADRRFSLRYHRAFDTYLQCAIASGHLRYPDRRAYRQQGAQTLLASQSNPGRTLRAARSVETLHAAFTR